MKYIVPFLINLKRRVFLITHWIFFVIKREKHKNFSERLTKEVYLLLKGVSSASLNLKKTTISKALQNRSNIHYRW
jgi:ribosomal protein S7